MNLGFGIVTKGRTWHVSSMALSCRLSSTTKTRLNSDLFPLQLICDSKAEFKPWMEAIKHAAHIGAAIPVGAPVTGGTEAQVWRKEKVARRNILTLCLFLIARSPWVWMTMDV